MRFLSLFSGLEAASEAWLPLGWTCAAVAEIDAFPSAVLAHHYPDVPNLGDVKKITEQQIADLGPLDLVVFGFPCQDLSVAGKRKGLIDDAGDHTRSGLFFRAMQIVRWAERNNGCRLALAENVPGLFSSGGGADFATVLGEMAGAEFTIPKTKWKNTGLALGRDGLVEWAVLDAQWFGVPQRRRRVFIIRDTGDWGSRPPILFERESLQGNSPPSRETRQSLTYDVAPCIGASGRGFERTGDTRGADCLIPSKPWPVDVAPTLNAHFGDKWGLEDQHALNGGGLFVSGVTHSLRADGFDASEDGTGRGTPLVPVATLYQDSEFGAKEYDTAGSLRAGREPHHQMLAFSCKDHGADAGDLAPTLRSMGHEGSHANAGGQVAVAIRTANTGANGHGVAEDVSHTLDGAQGQAVAFSENIRGELVESEVHRCLQTAGGKPGQGYPACRDGMAVRRLTPKECERLQGFPDGYTQVPYRNKPAADGPRYKALGNSMAIPVVRWIGLQLEKVHLMDKG